MKRSSYKPNTNRGRQLAAVSDDALRAAAEHMAGDVRGRFEERDLGFISGDWATGQAANIQVGEPYTRRGVRRIDVFTAATRETDDGEEFPYPAAWEFGHHNLWLDPTGKTFVRVETFGPALIDEASAVGALMGRIVRKGVAAQHGTLTRRTGRIELSAP